MQKTNAQKPKNNNPKPGGGKDKNKPKGKQQKKPIEEEYMDQDQLDDLDDEEDLDMFGDDIDLDGPDLFWKLEVTPKEPTTMEVSPDFDGIVCITQATFGENVNKNSRTLLCCTTPISNEPTPICVLTQGINETQSLNLKFSSPSDFSLKGQQPSTVYLTGYIEPSLDNVHDIDDDDLDYDVPQHMLSKMKRRFGQEEDEEAEQLEPAAKKRKIDAKPKKNDETKSKVEESVVAQTEKTAPKKKEKKEANKKPQTEANKKSPGEANKKPPGETNKKPQGEANKKPQAEATPKAATEATPKAATEATPKAPTEAPSTVTEEPPKTSTEAPLKISIEVPLNTPTKQNATTPTGAASNNNEGDNKTPESKKLTKSQKKTLKKKQQQEKQQQEKQTNGKQEEDKGKEEKPQAETASPSDATPKANETPAKNTNEKNGGAAEDDNSKQKKPVEKKLPSGIEIKDIKVGNGPEIKNGQTIRLLYAGQLPNKTVFDKHLTGTGFSYKFGSEDGIKGWHLGMKGMKLGGKRRIVVPPKFAFGVDGNPAKNVPGDATVTYTIEVLDEPKQ